jgi:hypothetical protein
MYAENVIASQQATGEASGDEAEATPVSIDWSPELLRIGKEQVILYQMNNGDIDADAINAAYMALIADPDFVELNPRFGRIDALTGGIESTTFDWSLSAQAATVQ